MELIKLGKSSQNEDISSMSIVHNKNMNLLESKINSIVEYISSDTKNIVFSKLTLASNENEKSDVNFVVTKNINIGDATFTITPVDDNIDMTKCIVAVRDGLGGQILCPIVFFASSINVIIDNIDDVVPQAFSSIDPAFSKTIVIIHFA